MSYNRWMPVEYNTELYHHGVKGMKWGIRRYQSYAQVPRKSGKKGEETGSALSKSVYSNFTPSSKGERIALKAAKDYVKKHNVKDAEIQELVLMDLLDNGVNTFSPDDYSEHFKEQHAKKVKKEQAILDRWTSDDWEKLSAKDQEQTVAVFEHVRDKVYDGYNNKGYTPKTKEIEEAVSKLYKERWAKEDAIDAKYDPQLDKIRKQRDRLYPIPSPKLTKQYEELSSRRRAEIDSIRKDFNAKRTSEHRKAAIEALKALGYDVNDKSINAMINMIEYD